MHPDHFIAALAARLQVSELVWNDEHVCRLVLDDNYLVDLEYVERDQLIQVYSVVHAHAAELPARFVDLLTANLFGVATNGAVLSLHLERDEIVLHRTFNLERIDIEWFARELDLFSDAVADWSQRLRRHHPEEAAEAPSSGDDAASGLLRV